jgi:hypothetical protein
MNNPRLALKLLACADASGVRQDLIGDLLEEIARGRSGLWVCQQLIGLYGLAFAAHVRNRARVTPQVVTLALCAVLAAGVSIAPVNRVLELWLALYLTMGTLSLFAHMASRAVGFGVAASPSTADLSDADH